MNVLLNMYTFYMSHFDLLLWKAYNVIKCIYCFTTKLFYCIFQEGARINVLIYEQKPYCPSFLFYKCMSLVVGWSLLKCPYNAESPCITSHHPPGESPGIKSPHSLSSHHSGPEGWAETTHQDEAPLCDCLCTLCAVCLGPGRLLCLRQDSDPQPHQGQEGGVRAVFFLSMSACSWAGYWA